MWYTLGPGPYSWIKVNVGLETSSRCATPRPRTIPLASVVLPTPRLPMSSTTPERGKSPARRSPRAIVSSSDAVRYLGTLLHGVRKIDQKIGREHALLAECLGAELSGETVQVNGRRHRLVRVLRELRDQARDHPGEDVAAAALAHGGRAGGVDPHAAVGERDHGALSFEDQGYAMFRGISTRRADAIRLNFGVGFAGQTRHFAGVRGEDAYARGSTVDLAHQRIRIQYHRSFERLGQRQHHRRDVRRASQAGTNGDHALAVE